MLIADFHIHSKYSRACSENLTLENIDLYANKKGLDILGTGDMTHPKWFNEIKNKLKEKEGEKGIYELKENPHVRFVLSTELALVFEKDKKIRKIHIVVLAPSIEVLEKINNELSRYGNLAIDGRPTLNISGAEIIDLFKSISNDIFVFPAHAWTPWFGVFGSKSGFDSLKEAFDERYKEIYAIETGLSSDPPMNWRISSLDDIALISNSDAHSLENLGREANMFDLEKISYINIISSIKNKTFYGTLEYYPEEGKYHFDGHRNCNVELAPKDAIKMNNICPICKKPLTLGVLHRIEDLADRDVGYIPKNAKPFKHIIPLLELISYVSNKNKYSKVVRDSYNYLITQYKNEINLLLNADLDSIKSFNEDLAKALYNIRNDKVNVIPGYDGVFGRIDPLNRLNKKETFYDKQRKLF